MSDKVDWSTFRRTTPDELREAWNAIDAHLARKRAASIAKQDVERRERSLKPCPFWADGVHCYVSGFIGGMTGALYTDRPEHMHDAKQCKCGARVRPVK